MKTTLCRVAFFVTWNSLFLIHNLYANDVRLTYAEGQPIKATFKDGRTAQIAIDRKKPIELKIPFQITDNPCADAVDLFCEYRLTLGADNLNLVWANHPDATKISSPVTLTIRKAPGSPKLPISFPVVYGPSDRKILPQVTAAIPSEEISCRDYSWLPASGKEVPDTFAFERFDAESMFSNPETQISENRTLGGVVGVTLKKTASGSLSLVTARSYTAPSFTVLNASIFSFVTRDADGKFCAISAKPDTGPAVAQFTQYFTAVNKPVPYIWGSDEYSSPGRLAALRSLLDTDQYDYE